MNERFPGHSEGGRVTGERETPGVAWRVLTRASTHVNTGLEEDGGFFVRAHHALLDLERGEREEGGREEERRRGEREREREKEGGREGKRVESEGGREGRKIGETERKSGETGKERNMGRRERESKKGERGESERHAVIRPHFPPKNAQPYGDASSTNGASSVPSLPLRRACVLSYLGPGLDLVLADQTLLDTWRAEGAGGDVSAGPEQRVPLHVRAHHALLQRLVAAAQRGAAGTHLPTGHTHTHTPHG